MPPARRTTPSTPARPEAAGERPGPAQGARRGRRPTLSLDAVLDGAIAVLDDGGEAALTLRALASRLGTGVGSLYHYVSGRDELLDRATDEILGRVVAAVDLPDDPYDALRALSVDSYRAIQAHPWCGAYLMRNTGLQPNSMRLFDLFGRQVLGLDLTPRQQFDAVSSLVSFVVGTGAEMRELPEALRVEGRSQAEHLHDYANAWRALDPDAFPFVHAVADEFEQHDDEEQFLAGVDLLVAGIAAQVAARG